MTEKPGPLYIREEGARRYRLANPFEWTGGPVDGLWLVEGPGQTCIQPASERVDDDIIDPVILASIWRYDMSPHFISSLRSTVVSAYYVTRDAAALVNAVLNVMQTIYRPSPALPHTPRKFQASSLYYRRGTRYIWVSDSFQGFPDNGVYRVTDGRRNQFEKLAPLPDWIDPLHIRPYVPTLVAKMRQEQDAGRIRSQHDLLSTFYRIAAQEITKRRRHETGG